MTAFTLLRRRLSPGVALAVLLGAQPVFGQGWLPTSWFASAEGDPQAMHPLAEKDGPWLILATTFRGETARDDARRLVGELRARHRLKAFTHEQAFDYTGEQAGIGLNPDGSPKRMRYANAERVIEVAVLVGDFASCEDPRAQKTLQLVKSLRPESLGGSATKKRLVADFLQANREHAGAGDKPPLQAAIMIPNPLLPDDYFARQEVDDFVLGMNADVAHSLLDCPGRYTVRVATFTGSGTFATGTEAPAPTSSNFVDVNRFLEALKGSGWRDPQLRGVERESRLVEAAENAHRLTEALRRAGWQAWEFHDRDSSMVCVGSIDQLAVPAASGRPEPHPEITRIVTALGPDPQALGRGQVLPRSVAGILLDVQPKPIDVPRRPAGRR